MKVLIGVPTYETICPETFKSIYGLTWAPGVTCQFDFVKGYGVAKARNDLAKAAIDNKFDYILMVDSDIILPSNALVSMLAGHLDICLGIYPRKNTQEGLAELFKLGPKDFVDRYTFDELDQMPKSKFEVKGGGYGCVLIRTDIIPTFEYPWFRYIEYKDGTLLSEDNWFSDQAAQLGYKIYADNNVRCGHAIRNFQWR